MPGQRLLVADAVHHRGHGAVGERMRRGGDRSVGVHRLRGDDPEVARRERRRVARRLQPRVHLAGAGEPEAVRVDRVDVRLEEVERPDLDVVERREVGREERPDGAAADDADPHADPPLRPQTAERELAAAGEAGRPHDEHERHQQPDDDDARPRRQVDRPPEDAEPVLGLREQGVEPRDGERPDDGAPEARHPADHEHRERDEREIEVERVGTGRQQVHVEASGEARRGTPRSRTTTSRCR